MALIAALCDDRVTPAQFKEIQSLVCTDKEVRRLYVQMMHLHAGLYYFASALPDMMAQQLGMNETMVLPAMTDPGDFETGEDLVLPGPVSVPTPPKKSPVDPFVVKGGIAAGVLLVLGLLWQLLPSKQPVQITQSINPPEVTRPAPPTVAPLHYVAGLELSSKPVWESALSHPDGFVAGDMLAIQSGVVQLRLFPAGRLVVEGPAEVLFVSETEIRLNRGRIVANYPGGGLVVQCPTGSVKDLGTEFGIAVNPATGNADMEVFEGRVSATLKSPAATEPVEPLILNVGQAAVLAESAVTKNPQGAIKQRFICNLVNQQVTQLDVADLISGGDGTTHRRGIAVDSLDGSIGALEPVGLRSGDRKYHRSHGVPVVDGAFVPDGTHGAMTVDSVGHQFTFTATTNSTMNRIWTGGPIPWADELGISTVIGGADYSTADHAIICTHCDNAITLDLSAVRRIYPDLELSQFHCHFANSYVNGLKGAVKINPVANAYVLIDGVSRYQKLAFTNHDGIFEVNIPIKRTDRFLTLAALDDGKEIDRDWILWTDASLSLVPSR